MERRISQEPGANGTEILNSLKYVRPGGGFKPNFTLLEKSDVNGENEIPLYTYLKMYCPTAVDEFKNQDCTLSYHPFRTSDIRWNFEKFLINKHGQPVARYQTEYEPQQMEQDIYNLLQEDENN
ncbi:hypothetical protein KUTeg_000223 [Tegillarca granosa]|uniref:Glutathione peroxidase n=1 Tax=Tegillarca granosa TaxID=220873 RepID=A0ABQ9FY33_TEGGR|nr:hypothetical protein KUTeg_000223 [Tegillarca granosa]